MCFTDYTKAFDREQHDELLKMLMNLDLYGKKHISHPVPVLQPVSLYKNTEQDEWISKSKKEYVMVVSCHLISSISTVR